MIWILAMANAERNVEIAFALSSSVTTIFSWLSHSIGHFPSLVTQLWSYSVVQAHNTLIACSVSLLLASFSNIFVKRSFKPSDMLSGYTGLLYHTIFLLLVLNGVVYFGYAGAFEGELVGEDAVEGYADSPNVSHLALVHLPAANLRRHVKRRT